VDGFRDDPQLREATAELALLKGVLQWQLEKLRAGDWDVLRADGSPADPATWFIQQGKLVIDAIAKVASLTFSDEHRAAMALLEPAIKVIQGSIHELVPAEVTPILIDTIGSRLERILVPDRV
jgi:hypothetical protein